MKTSCLCGGLNTQLLWVLLLSLFTFSLSGHANTLSYNLAPKQIAQGVWVLEGKREDFSRKNGGNIVNTGFIVGESGVVVIDTGPSKRYGQALRAQISALTEKPITDVLITHFHPDHFLGNQSFADIPIHALETTRMQINQAGDDFAENMYRLVGDWMRGTEVFIPQHAVTAGEAEFAGRAFELMALSGHTGADLVIFDKQTKTLFVGDIGFYQRALTTPHIPNIQTWKQELDRLAELEVDHVVPGHGPVLTDIQPMVSQMQDYLSWLDQRLSQSAKQGLSMNEVMNLAIPSRFQTLALVEYEYQRSVVHLYGDYEDAAFATP